MTLCFLDFALLIEVRLHDPLMQRERGPRRLEDLPAIDDAQRVIHAQPQPLQDGGQVPGIDAVAVDRRLASYCFEPGTIEKRRLQGVIVERLVEPGDGARCAFERSQQRSIGCNGGWAIGVQKAFQHQRPPTVAGVAERDEMPALPVAQLLR